MERYTYITCYAGLLNPPNHFDGIPFLDWTQLAHEYRTESQQLSPQVCTSKAIEGNGQAISTGKWLAPSDLLRVTYQDT